ncbi:hypothetical protein BH20BAC1_BH20BAC1_10570 [soil metagenome]
MGGITRGECMGDIIRMKKLVQPFACSFLTVIR